MVYENSPKNYYPKKNQRVLTKEQRETLQNAYGYSVKEIMVLYGLSYAKALAFFKKVKEKYGCCPMDAKQVRRVDVLAELNLHLTNEQKKVDSNERTKDRNEGQVL